MSKKKYIRLFLCAVLSFFITVAPAAISFSQSPEEANQERGKAFEQRKMADVVIYFESSERILLKGAKGPVTLEGLEVALNTNVTNKNLAVVMMSGQWSMKPEQEKESSMNGIEDVLIKCGFEKVVIQQIDEGTPKIIRE